MKIKNGNYNLQSRVVEQEMYLMHDNLSKDSKLLNKN